MLNLDLPITISGDLPDGVSWVSYTLRYADGVYLFASDEEPSFVVHALSAVMSALRGDNTLPEEYDPSKTYLFSVAQEGMVLVAWRNGTYEVKEMGPGGLVEALLSPHTVPDGWEEAVAAKAYPKHPHRAGKLRAVLKTLTESSVVALLYPENGLHPGALRAMVDGIAELHGLDAPMLILVETVSASLLSDYARNCGRPPVPPIIFKTSEGLLSYTEIDDRKPHYMGHFDVGDLYHTEVMYSILSSSD